MQLKGGILSGLTAFIRGLSTSTIYNGTGTFAVPSSGTGTLALTRNVVDLASNQAIGGQKTFSNIATLSTTNGIPGGQAVTINSLTYPYTTRLYSVNDTYSTDLYYPKFNGIDTLVSTASTATLTNKTMGTLKVRTNGSTFSQILTGTGSGNLVATSFITVSVTFASVFSSSPQVFLALTSSASNGNICLGVGSITTSGCTVYINSSTGGNITTTATFSYIAIG